MKSNFFVKYFKIKVLYFRFKENFKQEFEKGVQEAKEDLKKRRN